MHYIHNRQRVTGRFLHKRSNLRFRVNQKSHVKRHNAQDTWEAFVRKIHNELQEENLRSYSLNVENSITEFLIRQRVRENQSIQLATIIL